MILKKHLENYELVKMKAEFFFSHTHTQLCMYLRTLPHEQDVTLGHFSADFYRFEFKIFLLLEKLPYQGYSLPYYLLDLKCKKQTFPTDFWSCPTLVFLKYWYPI